MFFSLRKEKMFFAEHLALMIKGGIPLVEALASLREEIRSREFKKALDGVLKKVLAGQSLAESLGSFPRVFDSFFVGAVKIGEESGTLDKNLKRLAGKLRADYELKKSATGALVYPVLIVTMVLVIALGVSFFVLPRIIPLFSLLEVDLPLMTRALIAGASFLDKNWLLVLISMVIIIVGLRIAARFRFLKFYIDRAVLALPLAGGISKNINLARFAGTVSMLLASGLPVLDSWDISVATSSSEVYKKSLSSLRGFIERGEQLNKGFKQFPSLFPPVFSQMVLVGEESGTLEESFLYLADFYEKEATSALKNISGSLEPFLLILVGILVAFVALAIITPLYKFSGQLRIR